MGVMLLADGPNISYRHSTSLRTMVAFQVLVQTLCAPLTYLLVREAQPNERLALFAGLFVATYPFIVSNVGMVLQEPTLMLVASLSGLAVVAWCRRPNRWRAALVGLLFGLGALAKSPFVFGPAIILFLFLLSRNFRRQLPFQQVGLVCIVMALVILPWTIRNYHVSGGRWIPVNSQGSTFSTWMVADGNYVVRESLSDPLLETPPLQSGILLTYGNPDGIACLRGKNDALLKDGITQPGITEALAKASRSYLLEHPLCVFATTMRGIVLIFSPDASMTLTQSPKTRIAAMVLFHLPLTAGWLAGVSGSLRGKRLALNILSLFTVAYLLIHAPIAVGGGRCCVPVLPLIAITGCVVFGERSPQGGLLAIKTQECSGKHA